MGHEGTGKVTGAAREACFPLPVSLEGIDTDWLTRALRTRAPDITVRSVEILDIIRGTCTKIRLWLELDDAGRRAGIPETVFLKGGFEEHSRNLDFVLMTEALGYRDLPDLSKLNAPTCYYADWDEEQRQGIIIMEDLARRQITFGNPLRPRSFEEVSKTLALLARYHAATWGFPDVLRVPRLDWVETAPPFSRPSMQHYLQPEVWDHYVSLPRGAATSTRFHDREWAVGALARMAKLSEEVPNCIIHGDSHLGNAYFAPDGTVGFYDIVPRRAPALSEVCYHITLAMDVSDRPSSEGALVTHYLQELERCGVENAPDFDDVMRQYGAFLVEGFCLVLTNDAYFLPEPEITAYASRFSSAMLDNDTSGLLESYWTTEGHR